MSEIPACLADMVALYEAVCVVLGGIYHHLRSMVLRLELNNLLMCFSSAVMNSGTACPPCIAR